MTQRRNLVISLPLEAICPCGRKISLEEVFASGRIGITSHHDEASEEFVWEQKRGLLPDLNEEPIEEISPRGCLRREKLDERRPPSNLDHQLANQPGNQGATPSGTRGARGANLRPGQPQKGGGRKLKEKGTYEPLKPTSTGARLTCWPEILRAFSDINENLGDKSSSSIAITESQRKWIRKLVREHEGILDKLYEMTLKVAQEYREDQGYNLGWLLEFGGSHIQSVLCGSLTHRKLPRNFWEQTRGSSGKIVGDDYGD